MFSNILGAMLIIGAIVTVAGGSVALVTCAAAACLWQELMEERCKMKTVLWISRHNMTPEQLTDLERIMGGPVCLRPWRDTVTDVAGLASAVREADAVAAVLPAELLSQLLRLTGEKPVLQSVSERRPTGRTRVTPEGDSEPEFAFVHRCWQQILRLEIETRTL